MTRIVFGSIWLILIIYSITSAIEPSSSSEEDFALITNLSIGNWEGINTITIAIFCIMGIFPIVYAAFILFDSNKGKISPYPFAIAAFGLGAFSLLPYLALRPANFTETKEKNWLLKILDSRFLAISSSLGIIIFLVWGITNGDWSNFLIQRQNSQFVKIMSIDFCVLASLLPALVASDLERRAVESKKFVYLATFIPILGTLIYWCSRPQLPDVDEVGARG